MQGAGLRVQDSGGSLGEGDVDKEDLHRVLSQDRHFSVPDVRHPHNLQTQQITNQAGFIPRR